MTKSDTTETDVLNYIFKGTAIPWNSITNIYLALHTGDPGESGNQSTSETTYGNYTRVAVQRSGTGWNVSGNTAQNASLIQFNQCTSGSDTISYVSIGTASSGTGQILYSGQLNSPLNVANLIQPQFSAGALQIQED